MELIPHGRDIEVNSSNVYDYVRKYAEYRMVKAQEKALESIRMGVFDVLPVGALDGLTAEDLRLLLNGVGDISVAALISYTNYNDESGEPGERILKFKRWLWSIVERMTPQERQDLVSILCKLVRRNSPSPVCHLSLPNQSNRFPIDSALAVPGTLPCR